MLIQNNSEGSDIIESKSNEENSIFVNIKNFFVSLVSVIQTPFNNIVQSLGVVKAKEFDFSDWNVCKMASKERLNSEYTKYRFEFESNPATSTSLGMGQEIILCLVDGKGKTQKKAFHPTLSSFSKGFVEVLSPNTSNDKFLTALQQFSFDDELAFKTGKNRLKYKGKDEIIKGITVIVSGPGIATCLQLLTSVLPEEDSTVQDLEVLWINELKSQFVLNKEIENLELKFIDKLFVTRVVDNEVTVPDTPINDRIQEAVSGYSNGRIAIICASEIVATKAAVMLESQGYPSDNILLIGA
eukprot:gene10645-14297_t